MKFLTVLVLFAVGTQAGMKWCHCDNGARDHLVQDTHNTCRTVHSKIIDDWCYTHATEETFKNVGCILWSSNLS
ncbi:uncharacterized protein LY79DRAFT_563200 [Colletotrichum navitas]|uniref:Uncharacterized protein n=1 Tax=Colletotrichum navitas TaxID=681940 RepID=A0AAD8PTT6_9PEZI|nr:uncharacterized protein LY79DRAFT_563200 [Colletotrichum navitas]KAK1579887.1 hypothetical protein LY79DRAFT_563200 [Colletotrichum navitas]